MGLVVALGFGAGAGVEARGVEVAPETATADRFEGTPVLLETASDAAELAGAGQAAGAGGV